MILKKMTIYRAPTINKIIKRDCKICDSREENNCSVSYQQYFKNKLLD